MQKLWLVLDHPHGMKVFVATTSTAGSWSLGLEKGVFVWEGDELSRYLGDLERGYMVVAMGIKCLYP